ncbi:MAG: hypothetical protein JNK37_18210 [Verrucomicrobiales bacterium]|nr:hypothetical protein [Verrucomicrobiales bacterium]
MKTPFALCLVTLSGLSLAAAVDYKNDVLPIMKEHCWKCHSNEEEVKGNLALDDLDEMRDYQVGPFNIIRPGKPAESSFLEKMLLEKDHDDFMPRNGDPLPKAQLDIIEQWIAKGAVIDAKNPSDKEKAFLATGAAAPAEDEKLKFHSWTNTEGKAIEARFDRVVDGAVSIVMKDGRRFSVPLDKLSPDSRALAEKLAAAK